MIEYRKARKEELKEITELLIRSFRGYAMFEMYFNNEEKQFEFLQKIQETAVRTYYKKQLILVGVQDKKIISAALLEMPDKPPVGVFDYLMEGGSKVLLTGGLRNTMGFLGMLKEAGAVCHNIPGRRWYLEALAVSDSCQGQGFGSKMLKEGIKPYIEKKGGGVLALITNKEKNRTFYKKNHFHEFHETVIQRNGKEIGNWSYQMNIG